MPVKREAAAFSSDTRVGASPPPDRSLNLAAQALSNTKKGRWHAATREKGRFSIMQYAKTGVAEKLERWSEALDDEDKSRFTQVDLMDTAAAAEFRRKQAQLRQTQRRGNKSQVKSAVRSARPSAVAMTYYEDLDYLVSAFEEGKIRNSPSHSTRLLAWPRGLDGV